MASTSGTDQGNVSLDHYLDPMFRGDLAQHSATYDPAVAGAFYNEKLMGLARDYWQVPIVVPRQLHFNVAAPMKVSDPGHFDAPTFRGVSHTNTPVWLLAVVANSMLFRQYKLNLCAVVTWFWNPSEHGGFTYWADGAAGQPQRIPAPFWNTGCVAENEAMFHRGESIGRPDQWGVKGLTFQSMFEGDPTSPDHWLIRNGDDVIGRYATQDLRWLFHWTGIAFKDRAEFRTFADRTDDLTHEKIFEILMRDMRDDGIKISLPSDPLNDEKFRRTLVQHYAIGSPKIYPPEAPVAVLAA